MVALARDDCATSIQLQEQSLDLPQRTYEVQKRSSAIDLGSPNWPSGFDFIHLRLTVRYSAWWRLRKPERLELEISRADGTRDLQWMIAPPNEATDLWFYPWDAPELAAYFKADASQWRPNSHSAITGLRLWVVPLDWVSEQPESITVESANAVRVVEVSP